MEKAPVVLITVEACTAGCLTSLIRYLVVRSGLEAEHILKIEKI